MSDSNSGAENSVDYRLMASRILARRRLRPRFFDRQLFGEHAWEMLLMLLGSKGYGASVQKISDDLGISAAAALSQARLLASFDLVTMGDSPGSWNDIPIELAPDSISQLRTYFDRLIAEGLND